MSHTNSSERGCQCHLQLDPLPKGSPSWRNGSDSALDHYCHVCNTQLNSCKQTRIHVNGKRHEKRLIYLKYSLECEKSPSDSPPNENNTSSPEYTVPYYHYEPYVLPSYEPSGSFYYSPPPAIVQQSGYYDYHASVPPPVVLSHPSPPQSIVTLTAATSNPGSTPPGLPSHSHGYSIPNNASNHGVMSPSLTSGFSGSGADCKSTETSSILSAGSFNSNPGPPLLANKNNGTSSSSSSSSTTSSSSSIHHHSSKSSNTPSNRNSKKNQAAKKFAEEEAAKESLLKTLHKLVGKGLTCEVCQIAFPSKTVLENHLKGSRHNRKVKSRQVFRELQDAGAEFRHNDEVISCEVCKVSVNSSHQLQAHLAGQKHKVRCYRRGFHPSKALISKFSSTNTTSTSPLDRNKEKEPPLPSSPSNRSQSRRQSNPSPTSQQKQPPSSCPSGRAQDPPPLRLSLLGHPGSLKTDVCTSLMGAPPTPSRSTTTINLPVMNNRKHSSSPKHSKSTSTHSSTSNNSTSSTNSSRQKTSQKQKSENEDKKVAAAIGRGGTETKSSNVEELVVATPSKVDQIPIPSSSPSPSVEPEKSKININNSLQDSMNIKTIIPFKCETCQVTMANPAAPTPVS